MRTESCCDSLFQRLRDRPRPASREARSFRCCARGAGDSLSLASTGRSALGLLALLLCACGPNGHTPSATPGDEAPQATRAAKSPAWASYRIDGRVVALRDGKHEEPAAPASAARRTTAISGAPVAADLDGDGDEDAVVIMATEQGGSGTFYYVAVAELDGGAYTGSAGVLLGDRIAPQKVTFADGVVTVDYTARRPGEPMSTPPSVPASKRFVYRNGVLQPLEADKRF
jgi:hypothetical protein